MLDDQQIPHQKEKMKYFLKGQETINVKLKYCSLINQKLGAWAK